MLIQARRDTGVYQLCAGVVVDAVANLLDAAQVVVRAACHRRYLQLHGHVAIEDCSQVSGGGRWSDGFLTNTNGEVHVG